MSQINSYRLEAHRLVVFVYPIITMLLGSNLDDLNL